MKKYAIVVLLHFCLLACHADNDSIRTAISRQLQEFPQSHLQDIYKSFYQSCFGAEHLITDTASVRAYLHDEITAAAVDTVANPYYEPTGANGQFVRVYLRCVTENYITEQQLFDAFLRSAQPQRRMEIWHRLWQDEIVPMARKAGLDFSREELDMLTDASKQDRAVRHSDDYRNGYHPRYRIVERHIFETEIKPHIPSSNMENNDKALLEQTYKEMYRAMIAKDSVTLGRMLADDFVLVHMTGMRQAKHDYLRAIANGVLNYYSCEDTQLAISIKGESAQMIGRSHVAAAVFGGGRHTWSLQLDIVLMKQGGRWLMTEIKAGTY